MCYARSITVLYVKTFTARPEPAFLVDATRETVADDCRDAALSLLAGTAAGWGKRELAYWLVGPYAHATRHTPRGERVAFFDDDRTVDDAAIETLLLRVRTQLVTSLERAALEGGALDFSGDILLRGVVKRAVGADGEDAWFPVDAARLRLRDRLRSLFVAHYMNDPASYDTLFVCHRCEDVVFDELAKELGTCARHGVISDVVAKATVTEPVHDLRCAVQRG